MPFARLRQVHGDEVVQVVDPPAGPRDAVPDADALVTTRRGLGLMVRVADCVPVLLADPEAGVIGAVHAGRLGMTLDVVGRTVERMRTLGADRVRGLDRPPRVRSLLRGAGGDAQPGRRRRPGRDVGDVLGHSRARPRRRGRAQLAAADVSVTHVGRCTLEDEQLHSYRRDGGEAGRLAGLVWIDDTPP